MTYGFLCSVFKVIGFLIFFFKQKTAYEMRISDWSSDVCSSDLATIAVGDLHEHVRARVATGHRAGRTDRKHPLALIADITHRRARGIGAHERLGPGLIAGKQKLTIGVTADRKSTRLNSSHSCASRMPSSA